MQNRKAIEGIAIAGATASGKSALALHLAERLGGVVINADSAQVYADLRLLSARPSREDEERAPHALYGFIDGARPFSAADWAKQGSDMIKRGGRVPILVGGTGLYFRALFEGFAELPPISPDIREKWRALAQTLSAPELHEKLRCCDPVMAERLPINDTQRITRALEVFEATGQSLADLQNTQTEALIEPEGWRRVILDVERDVLSTRIAQRFSQMVEKGALDEVRKLLNRRLDPALPVMKAIGVPELAAHLRGETELEEAVQRAVSATRRYAKRQETWFRNQMPGWQHGTAAEAEKLCLVPQNLS